MTSWSSSFWADKYWLPRADTWADVPANFYHLIYPVYLSLPILVVRIVYEAFVGLSLGHWLGHVPEPLGPQIRRHLLGGFARQTKTKKVLETFWRFSAYAFLFVFGSIVLYDRPWLNDVRHCWIGYPRHPIDSSVWYAPFAAVYVITFLF